ncbi:Conserved Plasmodium protein, related [Eimeria maxima]|uniref:Conserved Plasmodium protein, related n=1 Tax=Eimeria maxima TaxID=5804 RepID=U6M7X5_EIMMA|nr:Conserved Plasmodium protein, related [Eimeria maxima]CDJ58539.1 Conserved Plasmodium protein, related [Eimeria maxima]
MPPNPKVCARRGIDSCGHSYPDRLSVPVEIELSHTGPALLLSFGSTMPKKANPCTASWGIDDVSIYLH